MDEHVKVSVIVPIGDATDYQTFAETAGKWIEAETTPFELIILASQNEWVDRASNIWKQTDPKIVIADQNRPLVIDPQVVSGKIVVYLLPGISFVPGILSRVVAQLDTGGQVCSLAGKLNLTDSSGRPIGVRIPGGGYSSRSVLKIWEDPSQYLAPLFMTQGLWLAGHNKICGGTLAENLYSCWCIAQPYLRYIKEEAAYLPVSIFYVKYALTRSLLEKLIMISKRYWYRDFILSWLSFLNYRLDRINLGRQLIRSFRENRRHNQHYPAFQALLMAALLAPEVAFYEEFFPFFKSIFGPAYRKIVKSKIVVKIQRKLIHPVDERTLPYLQKAEPWDDGWAGPNLVIDVARAEKTQKIILNGVAHLQNFRKPLQLTVFIENRKITYVIRKSGIFLVPIVIHEETEKNIRIEIKANQYFVPNQVSGCDDFRPLSYQLSRIECE